MNSQTSRVFQPLAGFVDLRSKKELGITFLAVFLGLVTHWIYEVLFAALDSGHFVFGTWVIVVARLGLSLITALVAFAGIWKQVQSADPAIRFFLALSYGFSADALVAPPANLLM